MPPLHEPGAPAFPWRRAGACAAVLALAAAAVVASDRTIHFGRRATAVPERVAAIYPTADRLPANLLRVYVVFDRPMREGASRRHLHLVDDAGREVERPFLQLEAELWDPGGRRLTVLFDPGRIKRGLRANLEDGPPLVAGRRYRLVLDAGWPDAEGRPLGRDVSKTFVAEAPDRASPVVDAWELTVPPAGTRRPLVVAFGEPLDRALLASEISLVDGNGARVDGQHDAAPAERGWVFTPAQPWAQGAYALRVSSTLEDVAGNGLHRLFDADLRQAPGDDAAPPVVERRFRVAAGT
jgi:hypothetical protein